jgi:outer membrane protein OmpA-like peptidoglycan-associated protein
MTVKTLVVAVVAAVALAGCADKPTLPGSSLGATFTAERFLNADRGGSGFTGALASEYTELGRRAAFEDVRWYNSTAYVNKASLAEQGVEVAPWAPDALGLGPDAELTSLYNEVLMVVANNKAERPAECARAQAMWDQYLESLRNDNGCPDPEDALAALREAINACSPPGPSNFIVYFGFDRSDLTDRARQTLDEAVAAATSMAATALSIVGHTDTVGSLQYNQALSERRARSVARGLVERGIPAGAMTLSGRSWTEPAVDTGPNVREPLNRRVEITLSK